MPCDAAPDVDHAKGLDAGHVLVEFLAANGHFEAQFVRAHGLALCAPAVKAEDQAPL